MSLWSWLKGSATKQETTEKFPQLVFLMEETLDERFGVEFVRGAIKHAFGVTITADAPSLPRGKDFLIGEWPIFDFSVSGFHMQILFLPMSYFDQRAPRIVPGDRKVIRQRARGDDLPKILDRHAGMIKVWLVGTDPPAVSTATKAYAHVGKMLAAFACEDTWAILWPDQNEIRVWDDAMKKTLAGGSPLQLFR